MLDTGYNRHIFGAVLWFSLAADGVVSCSWQRSMFVTSLAVASQPFEDMAVALFAADVIGCSGTFCVKVCVFAGDGVVPCFWQRPVFVTSLAVASQPLEAMAEALFAVDEIGCSGAFFIEVCVFAKNVLLTVVSLLVPGC